MYWMLIGSGMGVAVGICVSVGVRLGMAVLVGVSVGAGIVEVVVGRGMGVRAGKQPARRIEERTTKIRRLMFALR